RSPLGRGPRAHGRRGGGGRGWRLRAAVLGGPGLERGSARVLRGSGRGRDVVDHVRPRRSGVGEARDPHTQPRKRSVVETWSGTMTVVAKEAIVLGSWRKYWKGADSHQARIPSIPPASVLALPLVAPSKVVTHPAAADAAGADRASVRK